MGLRLLFILCCLCCCCSAASDVEFDHLMLSREWPFSFCSVESCSNKQLLQPKFNIHGLWAESPDELAKPEPVFCNGTKFNLTQLEPLLAQLQADWMDLKNPSGSGKAFWRREYQKHGSCVTLDGRYNSTYLYFKAALQLHEMFDLVGMLAKAGVQPGPNPIDASVVRAALRKSFGVDGGVRCFKSDGKVFLYELRLCFTKDLARMTCSETPGQWGRRPWALSRLIDAAAGLLRRVLGMGRRLLESGTYECQDGEMVLMPSGL